MKKIISYLASICCILTLVSCYGQETPAGCESVLIYQSWFGKGGVDPEPCKTGLTWCVFTTDAVVYKIIPEKHQVNLEDLMSNENTPIDAHTVIITKIKEGKSAILHSNFGEDWFNTNLYNFYSNRVRDYFSQHSPFDLMSNREILNEIDTKITKEMRDYVAELSKDKEFPVEIVQVTVGKAIPNKDQLDEMNRTARAIQARQTQEREAEVQLAREKAERQRAIADKAYIRELNLSTQDYINLKWIETVAQKQGANIDVMVGPATSMWNVRR